MANLQQVRLMSHIPLTPKVIKVLHRRYAGLKQPMRERVLAGNAIDLSLCRQTADGDYLLDEFIAEIDYVDCFWQAWIGSIGRVERTYWARIKTPDGIITQIFPPGTILASWSTKFWCDPRFECVFVRRFSK